MHPANLDFSALQVQAPNTVESPCARRPQAAPAYMSPKNCTLTSRGGAENGAELTSKSAPAAT